MYDGDRVPCDYKGKNLAVRVDESSQKPYYLAISIFYQGGQTEIVSVDVAQVKKKKNCFHFSILIYSDELINVLTCFRLDRRTGTS